jgi:hypothetical protein
VDGEEEGVVGGGAGGKIGGRVVVGEKRVGGVDRGGSGGGLDAEEEGVGGIVVAGAHRHVGRALEEATPVRGELGGASARGDHPNAYLLRSRSEGMLVFARGAEMVRYGLLARSASRALITTGDLAPSLPRPR